MNQKLIRFIASLTVFLLVFASISMPNVESRERQNGFLLLQNTTNSYLEVSRSIYDGTTFNVDSFEILNGKDGNVFNLEDCSYRFVDGKPMLPVFEKIIKIAHNETIANISTTYIDVEKLNIGDLPLLLTPKEIPILNINAEERLNSYLLDDHRITSDQKITNDHENTKSIVQIISEKNRNFISATEIGSVYPEKNTTYSIASNDGDRYLVLKINPIYIKNGEVFISKRINFKVDFSITDEEEIKDVKENSAVIITPNELYEQAQDLAKMQEEAGFTTEVIKLSEIQKYDQAEKPGFTKTGFLDIKEKNREVLKRYDYKLAFKIRKMLQEKLQNDEIDYLTILGDASYVPPSYYEFSADRHGETDQWVPTDVYYVSPFTNKKEFNFNISVGRLPVKSLKEAEEQIIKLQLYRDAIKENEKWVNSVSLFSGNPFREDYFGELATSRAVNNDVFNGMEIHKNYQTEDKFTTEEFTNTLTEGNSLMIWAFGHGSGTGFHLEDGAVTAKDLHALPAKSNLPIITSEACGNGTWDSRLIAENPKEIEESFGEAVISSKGAGIAYVGGARVNYAQYYITSTDGVPTVKRIGCMDKILEDYFTAFSKKEGMLGDWVRTSLYKYFVDELADAYWISPGDTKTFFGMTLLGDPTIALPFPEEEESFEIPEISIKNKFKMNVLGNPFFSIDNCNGCIIKSNSPDLNYIYADYENQDNAFILSGEISNKENENYEKTLDFLKKAVGTVRFETKDKKEKRIVFDGRYSYDAVVYNQPAFSLLRPMEKTTRYFNIINEGIEPLMSSDFAVDINGKSFLENQYPVITRDSNQTISVEYELEAGSYDLKANINTKEDETAIKDNELSNKLEVTDKPIYRVGVLTGRMFKTDASEEILFLSKINEHFKEKELKIEVVPVSHIVYENGDVLFDLLGFDALVLFDILWFSPNISSLSKSLNKFVDQGGKILGILPIDNSSAFFGITLSPIQSFFGIDPDANLVCSYPKDENCCFELDQPLSRFSKSKYEIYNQITMVPSDENHDIQDWSNTYLLDDAKILASSDQKGLTYIQYKENIFFYTGLMSKYSYEEKEDTFLLMCDMVESLEKSFSNVEIKKVYQKDQKNLCVGNKVDWVVEIKNYGSKKAENVEIIINEQETLSAGDFWGGQIKKLVFTTDSKQVGTKTLTVALKNQENGINSPLRLEYFVNERVIGGDDLFVEVDTEENKDYLISKEEQLVIKGRGLPGSSIKVGSEIIPVNSDGTFEYLASKEKNGAMIDFVPMYQDIEKEPLQVPIKWLQKKNVYLQINGNSILENGQLKQIESPPVIVNGRTVISISMVSDCFNAEIAWDGKTQTISIKYMNRTIKLIIGNKEASIIEDGETKIVTLAAPPTIINGRTMVPLRFIAESFGAKIDWEGESQVITLAALIEESVPEMEICKDTTPEDKEADVVFTSRNDLISYVIDFQITEEGLFLVTKNGISKYNGNKLVSFVEYPEELYKKRYGMEENCYPDKGFFTINENYYVINDGSTIYVVDRKTNLIANRITKEEKNLSLTLVNNFANISDLTIFDSKLYLLDKYEGILVYDLSTCKKLFTITIMGGSNYLEDMVQMGDYFVGTMKYDGLFTYNLKTHEVHECFFDGWYRYPTLIKKNEIEFKVLFASTRYCDVTLEQINSNDIFPIKSADLEEIELEKKYGISQMQYGEYGSKNYAILFLGTKDKNPVFTSKFVTINDSLTEYVEFIDGADKEYRRTKNLVPNARDVRIVSSQNRYIAMQNLPGNPSYLVYSTDGKVRKYKANYLDGFEGMTMQDAWGGDKYSLMNLSIDFSVDIEDIEDIEDLKIILGLDIVDFSEEKPSDEKFLELEFGEGDFNPSSYSFNEETVCLYDGYKSSLMWFDRENGDLDKRQYFDEKIMQKPSSASDLQFDQGKVYFLDYNGKAIYSATEDDGFIDRIDLSHIIQHSQIGNMVAVNGNIYFLDYLTSQIGVCIDGIFQKWIPAEDFGVNCIRSFYISDNEILINDGKTGNVTKQVFTIASDFIVSPEQIYGFEEDIATNLYPNEEKKNMLSLYIDAPFKKLVIETTDGIKLDEYAQKQSQTLSYSFKAEDVMGEAQEITINVDGFEKKIKINCEENDLFATFYNDSIFTNTWNGVQWGKAEASVKNGRMWIDSELMENIFDCDIRIKKDTITISFNDIKLEATKDKSFYIYENPEGKRYKRDGAMFKQNTNGDNIVNPDVFIDMMDGEKVVEESLIQVLGNSLFKIDI